MEQVIAEIAALNSESFNVSEPEENNAIINAQGDN